MRSYGVSGFPTLKWFPKDNKDGVDYSSGRSEDDFVKFINEKTGTKVSSLWMERKASYKPTD